MHGDGNTTAFGDGAATSAELDHVDVSGGGALSVAGNANGFQHNIDSHNETTTDDHQRDPHRGLRQPDHASTPTNSHNDTDIAVDIDSHDQTHTDFDSHNTFDNVDV